MVAGLEMHGAINALRIHNHVEILVDYETRKEKKPYSYQITF